MEWSGSEGPSSSQDSSLGYGLGQSPSLPCPYESPRGEPHQGLGRNEVCRMKSAFSQEEREK